MTLLMTLQTILEIAAVGFFIWGIFNEKKLVRFEERIASAVRRKALKVTRSDNACHKHCA